MKEKLQSGKKIPLWLLAGLIVLASRILLFAIFWYWKNKTGSDNGLFSSLLRWDSGWYANVAENGYGSEAGIGYNGQASWAFFPLVPLLERFATRLTGLPIRVAGVLLNSVFLYLLTWLGARYIIELDNGWRQALVFMLFLNFGPYNVYYSTLYTEVFFGLLICLALYSLQRRRWVLMGLCGAMASATRNTGVFIVFAVPVWCIQQYLREEDPLHKKSLPGLIRWVAQKPRLILGTFLMPLGLFVYMQYLYLHLGDGLAFMNVQWAWGKVVGNPIKNLWQGLINIGTYDFFQATCTMVVLYLLLHQVLRRRLETVLTTLFILIPLSTTVGGMTRYTLCSFPVLLELSYVLQKKERLAKLIWAIYLGIFGVATTWQWFQVNWVMT